ncbi:hypothetical protein KC952_01480 [Candidatus Saccharibacteria bacterium]|jgi:hypothetical protein|nr:hypothetical protein [Candidatus Saccharibacteria bacterium]
MTEPREPIPHDNGDFDIYLKKAVLAEALGAFSTRVLEDDMLFRAIRTTLLEGEAGNDGEPDIRTDFSVTPNIKDGKYSLCLEQSAKGDTGSMSFKFATMKYIPVCTIETDDTGMRGIVVDKSFVELALGRDAATEKPTQEKKIALQTAVRTVLDGVDKIVEYCEQRGVKVVSDKLGCPQVLEEALLTSYSTEHLDE